MSKSGSNYQLSFCAKPMLVSFALSTRTTSVHIFQCARTFSSFHVFLFFPSSCASNFELQYYECENSTPRKANAAAMRDDNNNNNNKRPNGILKCCHTQSISSVQHIFIKDLTLAAFKCQNAQNRLSILFRIFWHAIKNQPSMDNLFFFSFYSSRKREG